MSINTSLAINKNNSIIIDDDIHLVKFLDILDNIVRCFFLATHIFYVLIIILFKEYQKVSYFNMHHTNIIGLLHAIHYVAWINQTHPTFRNEYLNNVVCVMSEITWAVLKNARAYSIVVLAVFRYIAVFKSQLFSKIVNSLKFTLLSALFVWIVSPLIFVIAKYSSNTNPGTILCLDGSSTSEIDSIVYFLIATIFGIVLPIIVVNILYFFIRKRLSKISKNLNRPRTNQNQTNASQINKKDRRKEKRLALQFVLLNSLEIASCVFLTFLIVSNLIPHMNQDYYYIRQVSRILNNISQALIPFVSTLFHIKMLQFKYSIFGSSNLNNSIRT